jgi:hypothetical protein
MLFYSSTFIHMSSYSQKKNTPLKKKQVGSTHVLGHQKAPKHEILPREVESLREVKAVACSHLHTAFIAN